MAEENGASRGFWSTTTLRRRLPDLIQGYNPNRVESGSYALTIGGEAFVSPVEESTDALTQSITLLGKNECFTIPPGQFAYLITSEIVEVPDDALALISIKFSVKWRGLVNVSGFHVDPGYKARLIFAVFNASPAPIHLRSGDPCFLIWYAYFDQRITDVRTKPGPMHIDQNQIISGAVPSYAGLKERLKTVEDAQKYYTAVAALLVSVAVVMLGAIFKFPQTLFPAPNCSPSPNFRFTGPALSEGRRYDPKVHIWHVAQ